jgi:hypothetical protein
MSAILLSFVLVLVSLVSYYGLSSVSSSQVGVHLLSSNEH